MSITPFETSSMTRLPPLNRSSFRVLWPDAGLEGTMGRMAGRERHSAEDIVHKLRRADVDRPRWQDARQATYRSRRAGWRYGGAPAWQGLVVSARQCRHGRP